MNSDDVLIIAIDGGAGTGTSTAAEGVAQALNIPHLNTGSMYRALAWEALRLGLDVESDAECALVAETAELEYDNGMVTAINGRDLTNLLYTPAVSQLVPIIARHPNVRAAMVKHQRAIALQNGAVMEGRDIGTVVFPDTPHKFYLICDPAERVRRVNAGGRHHETVESLLVRDETDATRTVSAFRRAADAIDVDTTHLSIAEVITQIVERVVRQRKAAGLPV